ncbi:MAG TPA: GMC oxidoreductase [Fimbriimonadaceae bacterium]|nr:GMC oxidoreductase [Fimbriimonadaceae bacterium]
MLVSVKQAETQHFDFCLIGAGIAGTALALELARVRPGAKILLVEFGSRSERRNELDESISVLTPKTHNQPYDCTNKGFGGSSQTWGGRCVSYDEADFLKRPPTGGECTWDAALFEEARRYYPAAAEFMGCGGPEFSLSEIPEFAASRIAEGFEEGDVLDSCIERWSPPLRVRARYLADVEASRSIHLLEQVRVDEIRCSDGTVVGARAVDRSTGAAFNLAASNFVLCTGAQEATRLLQSSPTVFEPQGGPPACLGGFYQGHLSGKIASIKFRGDPKKTDFAFLVHNGAYIRRRLQLSTETLLRERLLNTALWLDNPPYHDPTHRSGAQSLIYLATIMPVIGRKLLPPAIAESVKGRDKPRVGPHLANVFRQLPRSLTVPFGIFRRRYFGRRRLPGVFLYSPTNEYALHYHAEQVPSPRNTMRLTDDGSTFEIAYGFEEVDVDSVIRTHEVLDTWLRKTGCGSLRYWFPKEQLPGRVLDQGRDGLHQVGTTRIGSSPAEGVVDGSLKVWGTRNLYVCASSAFPTSGQANPTFLLVAFALRLAEHLSSLEDR